MLDNCKLCNRYDSLTCMDGLLLRDTRITMRPANECKRVVETTAQAPACAARQGITIADCSRPDMPLIYANDAFTRITGYQLDETLGKNCRFLQARPRRARPARLPRVLPRAYRARAAGAAARPRQVPAPHRQSCTVARNADVRSPLRARAAAGCSLLAVHLETARTQCQATSDAPAACLGCADPIPAWGQGEGTDAEALGKMRKAMRDAQPCVVQLLNYKKNGVQARPPRHAGCSGQRRTVALPGALHSSARCAAGCGQGCQAGAGSSLFPGGVLWNFGPLKLLKAIMRSPAKLVPQMASNRQSTWRSLAVPETHMGSASTACTSRA